MRWTFLAPVALTLSLAIPGASYAQDKTQDQDRDRLQTCGALSGADCALFLEIREKLKGCDGSGSADCADLLRERDRLQTCADADMDQDRDRDRDRDCDPASDGSGGSGGAGGSGKN